MLMLVLLMAFMSADDAPSAPKLVLERTSFDAVLVHGKDEAPSRVVFPVRNGGDAPLELVKRAVTCGCTEAAVPETLLPDETGEIVFRLDAKAFSDDMRTALVLASNDPASPETVLSVAVDWSYAVSVAEGEKIALGTLPLGVPVTRTLTLNTCVAGEPLTPSVTPPEDARLTAVVQANGGPDAPPVVTATFAPGPPCGAFEARLTIETGNPARPAIPVTFSGVVQGEVKVRPWRLNLGSVAAGETAQQRVLIEGPYTPETLSVETGVPGLAIAPDEKNPRMLVVRYLAPDAPGVVDSVLYLASPTGERVRIPILARVWRREIAGAGGETAVAEGESLR